MLIQIIYCHPSQKSYTFQVLEQLKSSLKRENLKFEVSDLYAMNFPTDMTEKEYLREGLVNLDIPIAEDVKAEHKKIEKSDCIIFVYPVWWSDCPAKLKGWFDRVYAVGYAYGCNEFENTIQKMKTIPYGIVLCTAGHPNAYLNEIGIAESMRNIMIDDRLGQRFKTKEMILLGGTIDRKKVENEHCQIIKNIPEKIKKYCY